MDLLSVWIVGPSQGSTEDPRHFTDRTHVPCQSSLSSSTPTLVLPYPLFRRISSHTDSTPVEPFPTSTSRVRLFVEIFPCLLWLSDHTEIPGYTGRLEGFLVPEEGNRHLWSFPQPRPVGTPVTRKLIPSDTTYHTCHRTRTPEVSTPSLTHLSLPGPLRHW